MVAVVGIPFLLLVLIWAPAWATMVLLAAMCAIAAWELLHAAGALGRGLTLLTILTAALGPVARYLDFVHILEPYAALWQPLCTFLLFVVAVVRHGREDAPRFRDITAAIFAGWVFPTLLNTLLTLRTVPELGKVLVFVPLCISFGSDTFALFAGMAFGKHKLAPRVSPKKTVEGAVGGLVGGVLGALLIRWIGLLTLQTVNPEIFSIPWALVMGLVGSVLGQLGDLSFSVIKREFGIKDYGNLLPGHGGILDRFDSVSFVAPFVWIAWFFQPF